MCAPVSLNAEQGKNRKRKEPPAPGGSGLPLFSNRMETNRGLPGNWKGMGMIGGWWSSCVERESAGDRRRKNEGGIEDQKEGCWC